MTRWDIVLVVALLGLSAFGVPAVLAAAPLPDSAPSVVVRGPGGETVIPLDAEGLYHVQGAYSEVVFEAHAGRVRCVRSECDDKICVNAGDVGPGRPVVCAPNGVTAVLSEKDGSGRRAGLDAVSR